MKQKNKNALKILFVSNGIFVFADRLLGPLYAIFAEKISAGVLSVSFSWFVFMLSATIFAVIVSKYGDKVKEQEHLLIAGYIIRMLSWILYIFVSNIYMFLLIQILIGMGEALGSPAFDAIFAKHLDKGIQIKEYANWKIILNFAIGIASMTGGLIVYFFSFQLLFVLMAILALIATIIVLVQPRELL